MLASKCDKMDGIIFTHEHSDHTAGIDDIRPFNFRQGEIPVYAHHRVIENLNKRFEYVLKPLIGILSAISKTIEVHNNVPFEIGNSKTG
jgi:phosphoribosyl 1,2-cyclic phosphate phosphodiesterase